MTKKKKKQNTDANQRFATDNVSQSSIGRRKAGLVFGYVILFLLVYAVHRLFIFVDNILF